MNVIFMGTPDFAVPTLLCLINSKEHKVVSVFTRAPKAKGRGMKMEESSIHKIANRYNIPVYTPKTLMVSEAEQLIKSIKADIIVVVAYGFIIPLNIIEAKKFGCLNIHPSKLPKYRGAAPLQRTIINGDTITAVCIIQMNEGLDTGDIILQKNFSISPRVTLPELHDKCANVGAELLISVLGNIEQLPRIKQSKEGIVYASKLTKEEAKVDWTESAYTIDCKVRGMNPWPGVFFEHDKKVIKIIESDFEEIEHIYTPGQLINNKFKVACGSGILHIKKLQPAGKTKMVGEDYLRGILKKDELIIFS